METSFESEISEMDFYKPLLGGTRVPRSMAAGLRVTRCETWLEKQNILAEQLIPYLFARHVKNTVDI